MLTHRNLIANALHFQVCAPFTPDTRWLIVAPLFHAAGSMAVLATVWNGGRNVVLPAFDPGAAPDLVERHRVPGTTVGPTMLAALAEGQPPGSRAGGPLPPLHPPRAPSPPGAPPPPPPPA